MAGTHVRPGGPPITTDRHRPRPPVDALSGIRQADPTARSSSIGRSGAVCTHGHGTETTCRSLAVGGTGAQEERPVRAGGRGVGRCDMADPTGFEPAISSVTGWHVGPLHHGSGNGEWGG